VSAQRQAALEQDGGAGASSQRRATLMGAAVGAAIVAVIALVVILAVVRP
jgi:hypothetical protein